MEISSRNLQEFAADCAEHTLSHFEELWPEDQRPRAAIAAARACARGEINAAQAEEIGGLGYLAAPGLPAAAYAAYAAAKAAYAGRDLGSLSKPSLS